MKTPHSSIRQFICVLVCVFGAGLACADEINSREYIDRAVEMIQEGEFSLARTYLAPALIDPRLSSAERSRAYYLRGYSLYADGLPVSAAKDYARALEFNADNGAVLVALGGLYHRGEGVEENAELAFAFFDSAATAGHPEGELFVGYALLEGRGVEQNIELGRQRLEKTAGEGDANAMLYLGRSYRAEFGDEADASLALKWYERAEQAGSLEAKVALAYMYYKGEFGEADLAEAVRRFEIASEAGSSAADVALGHMYLVGEGVPTDPNLARELLERAARAGNLAGCLSLGHLFEAGIGVTQDLGTAKQWYLKGAEAGFGQAQLRLFYLLLRGGDKVEATHWIAKAAEQDLPQAQNDYAWLLSTSESVDQRDGTLALDYAERAVAQIRNAAYLDTLAAAYAELGLFTEAVSTQEQALALVSDGQADEAIALADHLQAYQRGQPWRE